MKKYKLTIPGDEFFQEDFWICDDSVKIKAEPYQIWPWLVQMGTGRAGWYSYDLLDNLGKASLNHIDPKLQNIYKGMKIIGAKIYDYKENEFLTYQFGKNANATYFLQKTDDYTLLTTRARVAKVPGFILDLTLKPGHWIMQKKQFSELKKRVESNID